MRASILGAKVHFACVSLALAAGDPGLEVIVASTRAERKLDRVESVPPHQVGRASAIVEQRELRKS